MTDQELFDKAIEEAATAHDDRVNDDIGLLVRAGVELEKLEIRCGDEPTTRLLYLGDELLRTYLIEFVCDEEAEKPVITKQ